MPRVNVYPTRVAASCSCFAIASAPTGRCASGASAPFNQPVRVAFIV
jgi:hypothetical protein